MVEKRNKSYVAIHLGADYFMRDGILGKADAHFRHYTKTGVLKGTLSAADSSIEGGRGGPIYDVAGSAVRCW